jgi:hypothetical protein
MDGHAARAIQLELAGQTRRQVIGPPVALHEEAGMAVEIISSETHSRTEANENGIATGWPPGKLVVATYPGSRLRECNHAE